MESFESRASHALCLHAPRITLVAATAELLRAELSTFGEKSAAPLLDTAEPDSWPPEFLERDDIERSLDLLTRHPDSVAWGMRYLLEHSDHGPRLVGIAGFGGPPGDDGEVMLGYSLVPAAQGRGLATEAARALVSFGFSDRRVRCVAAETFETLVGSIRVLEKTGFRRVLGAATAGAIRFEIRPKEGGV